MYWFWQGAGPVREHNSGGLSEAFTQEQACLVHVGVWSDALINVNKVTLSQQGAPYEWQASMSVLRTTI